MIKAHFDKTTEVEAPDWTSRVTVPQANVHDHQVTELTKQKEKLEAQIDALKSESEELLKYVWLLFGYGKAALEPIVRSAFRLIGFIVPEPEEYEGEWDVELRETESTRTALGEVEGSEGVIDVDKYRQLLDYIEAEALEGRDHKGILIGNGFRLLALEAPERQNQFSDHAQRGAARNDFCLVPNDGAIQGSLCGAGIASRRQPQTGRPRVFADYCRRLGFRKTGNSTGQLGRVARIFASISTLKGARPSFAWAGPLTGGPAHQIMTFVRITV